MQVYISNNINYYDSLLINGYYKSSTYILADTGSPPVTYGWIPSYLGWYYPGVQKVENIPGEWENTGTQAILAAYSPAKGGGMMKSTPLRFDQSYFVRHDFIRCDCNGTMESAPVWWSKVPVSNTCSYFDSIYLWVTTTHRPSPVSSVGVKTDAITNKTTINSGDQVGISKFTDLTENFRPIYGYIYNWWVPRGFINLGRYTECCVCCGSWPNELATVFRRLYMSHGPEAVKPEAVVATAV